MLLLLIPESEDNHMSTNVPIYDEKLACFIASWCAAAQRSQLLDSSLPHLNSHQQNIPLSQHLSDTVAHAKVSKEEMVLVKIYVEKRHRGKRGIPS